MLLKNQSQINKQLRMRSENELHATEATTAAATVAAG